jgi:iron complex outermembrane receptor protein
MHLKNEIIFDAVNFVNFNLPRTQRRGAELQASAGILSDLRARGAFSVTDARFDEGPNAGKVVPVISPYTASATVEWDPFKNVMVSGIITYVSEKRMDNDQRNFQTQIPAYTLVDLRVNGIVYDRVTWSAQVNNLFDKDYYNYALASPTVYNVSNAYPLPGQTFLFRLGMKL